MSPAPGMWIRDLHEDRFDRVIEGLLVGLLAFMPLAFGAVEAWSEEVVIALVAAMAITFVLKAVVERRVCAIWTWAYIPVLLFICMAMAQWIPMPRGWVQVVSPNTVAGKTGLLGDLPNADEALRHMTISFYPYATWHDLRLVLALAVVFIVVVSLYRRPDQIMRLLFTIAIIGAGMALVALAQDVVGNNKIYWFVSSPHGTALSGAFINHSHYAQFMNLSIGAALSLIFVKVHQAIGGRRTTPAIVTEYLSSADGKLVWGLAAMIVLGAATIFASLSRGGMISLMIAGAFTTLVFSSRRSLRGGGWIMAVLALGAFICVLYVGFDAVCARLGSLGQLQHAQGGRWQILRDIALAWTRFPVVGTGLGTHEVVYPMFDRSTVAAVAAYAENEYAQAAEETGIVGLAALITFGVLVWSSYTRAIRTAGVPLHSAAYGLGFGLTAIMIQSLSDFGQHVPANVFLSVIFCALMLRLPHLGAAEAYETGSSPVHSRWKWVVALAVLAGASAAVLLEADQARRGQGYWRKVLAVESNLVERQWEGSDEEYVYLLDQARKAAACQPDNVTYQHWLNVYRWHAISRISDPNTGEVVLPPEALRFADRIADELCRARALCPTFGPTWCVLGQLERFILGRTEQGTKHIRQGIKLAPCDPAVCYVAGLVEADEGRPDIAVADLARAAQLDRRLLREVTVKLVDEFDRPDAALQVARDDISRLGVLADVLDASEKNTNAITEARKEVVTLVEQKCKEPGAPAWGFAWLAEMCKREGKNAEAIQYYRKALDLYYSKASWHFNLAKLLAGAGCDQEAIQEARACLRLRPEDVGSKRLIETLTAHAPLVGTDGPRRQTGM